MSRRFIKKPIEIEAFQLGSDTRPEWADIPEIKYYIGFACINTLEGEMRAEEGDFIIKGIKGELYPCKSDIFWASYEEINSHYVVSVSEPIDPGIWWSKPTDIIPVSDDCRWRRAQCCDQELHYYSCHPFAPTCPTCKRVIKDE